MLMDYFLLITKILVIRMTISHIFQTHIRDYHDTQKLLDGILILIRPHVQKRHSLNNLQ